MPHDRAKDLMDEQFMGISATIYRANGEWFVQIQPVGHNMLAALMPRWTAIFAVSKDADLDRADLRDGILTFANTLACAAEGELEPLYVSA